MKRPARSLAVAAIVLSSIAAGGGVALSADSSTPIRGCVDKRTGTLRVLDAGEGCRKREIALRWSQRGPRGYTGAAGAQGPAGADGAQGPVGADGAQGAQGPVGADGAQGPVGADGAQGPVGADGARGPAGADGKAHSFAPAGEDSNWAEGPGTFVNLRSGTQSTQSAGFGVNAFRDIGSGANNTGFGYGAGRTSTGSGNTALGTAAMFDAGGGNQNVAVGLHAGRHLTGSGNTVIGADADGRAQSTIDETVAVGRNALAGSTGAVALGSGAQARDANSVAIGQDSTTNGVDQVNVGPRDVEITESSKGVVLRSPNGTRFRVTITNAGTFAIAPIS